MRVWWGPLLVSLERWRKTRVQLLSLSLPTMWGPSGKVAIYRPEKGSSPETKSASTLISNFPASRTVINVYCLSQSMEFHYSSPSSLRQPPINRKVPFYWEVRQVYLQYSIVRSYNLTVRLFKQQYFRNYNL